MWFDGCCRRKVRQAGEVQELAVHRVRCPRCRAGHAVLPDFVVARRLDTAGVTGAAAASAAGAPGGCARNCAAGGRARSHGPLVAGPVASAYVFRYDFTTTQSVERLPWLHTCAMRWLQMIVDTPTSRADGGSLTNDDGAAQSSGGGPIGCAPALTSTPQSWRFIFLRPIRIGTAPLPGCPQISIQSCSTPWTISTVVSCAR
jgi:hypothetical protein